MWTTVIRGHFEGEVDKPGMLDFTAFKQRRYRKITKNRLQEHVLARSARLNTRLRNRARTATERGTGNDKPHEIVISLTSHGERIGKVHLAIESLMCQTLKADRIVLCLHEGERQRFEASTALQRQQARGLEVLYCPRDLGPYTKYFYTMQRYPESLVITVDDDMLYPIDMVQKLYAAYCEQPDVIHCHRAHRMRRRCGKLLPYKRWDWNTSSNEASLDIFPTGVGGVLYFPGSLHPDAFSAKLFAELSPSADDVWLKAMSMLQGTPCHALPRYMPWVARFATISGSQSIALKRSNKNPAFGNDACLARTLSWYGLIAYFLFANVDDVNAVILNQLLSLGLVV